MLHPPVINYGFSLAEAAAAGGWHTTSRYAVWVGRQAAEEIPLEVLQHGAAGEIRRPVRPRMMRVLTAGQPHRIAHLFAPWRLSDADTVYVRAAMEEGVYNTLVVTHTRAARRDQILWLCPACGSGLGQVAFETARDGVAAFWPFLLGEVRAFNADTARRICPDCGTLHPICYGFERADDSAGEAAARAAW